MNSMRSMGAAAAAGAVLALAGCINAPLVPPQATLANIEQVRRAPFPPLAVGSFALGAGLPAELDRSISVRGSTMTSPYAGSMALYLRETLVTELKANGKYDPAATVSVSGWLTGSELDAGSSSTHGSGKLAARFVVKQGERTLYDAEQAVQEDWDSSFLGVVAVPGAFNAYAAMYGKLVGKLFADPAFRQAAATR